VLLGLHTQAVRELNILYSQINLSLRLTEWLLDQIQTQEVLDTVSSQFITLISQTKQELRGDLCAHIGRLIFQRATQDAANMPVKLFTQLCHLLFLNSIKQTSSLSSGSLYIHEHVFRIAIVSLESGNSVQCISAWRTIDESSVIPPTNNEGNSSSYNPEIRTAERTSILVSELYNFGLISIAQTFEYLSYLIASPTQIQARLAGLCTLLEEYDLNAKLSTEPWSAEVNRITKWAMDAISTHSLDMRTRTRVKVNMIIMHCIYIIVRVLI
jgi:hypothetical protein